MARTTGTVSLAELVHNGTIESGERIVLNRRSAPSIEATVESDGMIKAGRSKYKTPSAAAKELLAVGSIDGWLRFRVPRLGSCTLADLRGH
jgi:hypothetical protein